MPFTTKDGGTIEDKRLDRLVQFDERSREFPIRAAVATKRPRSYTWRCNSWFDQGREGACVAFALGHDLAARPAEVQGLSSQTLRHVYFDAQKIDPWPGGEYPGASPQYGGTSVLAGVKVLHKIGYFKNYRWAFGLSDLILGVGYNGPAVIGVNWYDGMYDTNRDGYITVSGDIAGGHAILVRGVDIAARRFLLRNSWGEDWGVGGDAFLSFDDMDRLLHEDGEAVFMVERIGRLKFQLQLKR